MGLKFFTMNVRNHWFTLISLEFILFGLVTSVCIVLSGDLSIERIFNVSFRVDRKPLEQEGESSASFFFYSRFRISTQCGLRGCHVTEQRLEAWRVLDKCPIGSKPKGDLT